MLLTKMCSFIDQKKWRQNGKTVTILKRHVTQGERDSFNQVSESHINMFEILKKAFFSILNLILAKST